MINASAFLTTSNLEEVELVKFTQLPLSLEELGKLWSVFFQTTHVLSVAFQGTVVLIEGRAPHARRCRYVNATCTSSHSVSR